MTTSAPARPLTDALNPLGFAWFLLLVAAPLPVFWLGFASLAAAIAGSGAFASLLLHLQSTLGRTMFRRGASRP